MGAVSRLAPAAGRVESLLRLQYLTLVRIEYLHDYSPSGRIMFELAFPVGSQVVIAGRYGEVGRARMPPPAVPGAVLTKENMGS